MHLIKDENGNLIHHGHEHTHEDGVKHTHTPVSYTHLTLPTILRV